MPSIQPIRILTKYKNPPFQRSQSLSPILLWVWVLLTCSSTFFPSTIRIERMAQTTAPTVTGLDRSLRICLQGTMTSLKTSRTARHLAAISTYYAAHLHHHPCTSFCSGCSRRHHPMTLCLPAPFFTEELLHILCLLVDGTLATHPPHSNWLDFVPVGTYFLFL